YDTRVEHLQDVRKVGTLLSYDLLVKLDEQDVEGALLACSALFNTARAVGDEPVTISQIVRLALRKSAFDGLARLLLHPRPLGDAGLANFQKMLEDELHYPLLKVIFRGERARLHALHANLANGDLRFAQLQDRLKSRDEAHLRAVLTKSHASYLRTYTELMESAEAPPERWEQ